jgi:hypothetical protein
MAVNLVNGSEAWHRYRKIRLLAIRVSMIAASSRITFALAAEDGV